MARIKEKRIINFWAEVEMRDELNQIADIIQLPYSQIVREAVRAHLLVIKHTDPRYLKAQKEMDVPA